MVNVEQTGLMDNTIGTLEKWEMKQTLLDLFVTNWETMNASTPLEVPNMKEILGKIDLPYSLEKMKIQLWYSEEVCQWRWTLTSETDPFIMESGNREDLREAMNDVASTVEWILDKGL